MHRDKKGAILLVIDDDEAVGPDPQSIRSRRFVRGHSPGERLEFVAEVPDITAAEDLPQLSRYCVQLGRPHAQQLLQLREDITLDDIPYDDLRVGTARRTEDRDAADVPVGQAAVEPEGGRLVREQLTVDPFTVERSIERTDRTDQSRHSMNGTDDGSTRRPTSA